jgi:putative transposase
MFIHLGSRRVFCSAPAFAPDSAWVTQQARNTLIWCEEQGITPDFLIRDADTKFSASFDTVWASEAAQRSQDQPARRGPSKGLAPIATTHAEAA